MNPDRMEFRVVVDIALPRETVAVIETGIKRVVTESLAAVDLAPTIVPIGSGVVDMKLFPFPPWFGLWLY